MHFRRWDRSHQLDRMKLSELTVAFFQYPAVWGYIGLCLASAALSIRWSTSDWSLAAAAFAALLIYPVVWYCLHRWVLHSRWMYKSRLMAGIWKRIHYDHHMDPNHLAVLFGALHTTLPTIALATAPVGWAIGGKGAAAAAFSAGLFATCVYEFIHCVEHLPYKPKNPALARMKALHLSHHFHDETGNFGITNFGCDRLLGTLYDRRARPEKSPTVFNLGYDDEAAARHPWVEQLSNAEGAARSAPSASKSSPARWRR